MAEYFVVEEVVKEAVATRNDDVTWVDLNGGGVGEGVRVLCALVGIYYI